MGQLSCPEFSAERSSAVQALTLAMLSQEICYKQCLSCSSWGRSSTFMLNFCMTLTSLQM